MTAKLAIYTDCPYKEVRQEKKIFLYVRTSIIKIKITLKTIIFIKLAI